MSEKERLFFELVRVAIGKSATFSKRLSEKDWEAMLAIADKQAVVGGVLTALERLNEQGIKPPTGILLEWIGIAENIRQQNCLVCKRCQEIERIFKEGGFKCCVLKGQGTALYYDNPERRQSGDIDLWVTKDGRWLKDDVRIDALRFAKEKGCHIGHVDIKHSDIDFFEDVPVEVHFLPSWMFNPFKNKRLQNFFERKAKEQFMNYDKATGFTHTTVDFDVVFSLVHIYRHVFDEGIGLRQLLDYYHILQHTGKEQREDAFEVLKKLGMRKFAGGVMYVMRECFAMDQEYYLCPVNERHGRLLLKEMLIAGNFGQYDNRIQLNGKDERFSNGFIQLKRNLRFLRYYPSEVLWSPVWKLWHWGWRKWKGYL